MSRRFCGKCNAVALLDVVSCIGQCRRTFHRACVGPSAVNFATRTELAENRMFWCCTQCRKELFGKATGIWTLLPQEVLAQIWNHLDTADLLHVRQVCLRWKDAFDQSPSLFGRLKIFIRGKAWDLTCEPQWTAAVIDRNTLEELHTPSYDGAMFRHLENMPIFRVSLPDIQADTDYGFIQTHRDTLEDIQIAWITNCEILAWIGRVCPHLKRISAAIPSAPEDALASFLPIMPQLQYLKLEGFAEPEPEIPLKFANYKNIDTHMHAPIAFENLRSPHLKELTLNDFDCIGIAEYLRGSPNIQQIRLQYCGLDNWTNFMRAIEQCRETLQHLTLNDFRHNVTEFHLLTKTLPKLTFLSFGVRFYPKVALLSILAACPHLEVAQFKKVESLDDEVILALLRGANGLRELTVLECRKVTTASAKYAFHRGLNLKQLRIDRIKIPARLLTQLTKGRRIAVLN